MIEILHNLINKVVPIIGLSDNEDGNYRVDYVETPTAEQVSAVEQIISAWPQTLIKINKQKELDQWFQEQQASGYTTSYGWKLGLKESDVILLTGAFVLAKEAHGMGLALPYIMDMDGIPHELSFNDLTSIMLLYGQYRADLSTEYANRKRAIEEQ
jgi:hypothetical protein